MSEGMISERDFTEALAQTALEHPEAVAALATLMAKLANPEKMRDVREAVLREIEDGARPRESRFELP